MSKVDRFWCDEARNIRCVREADYDALLAERDAVERALLIAKSDIKVEQRVSANLREHKNDYMDAAEVTRKALLAEIETLKAERDALKKDAERYRWLRMADWWNSPLCVIRDPKQQAKPGTDCPSRDRLDEAIDAAQQGAKP